MKTLPSTSPRSSLLAHILNRLTARSHPDVPQLTPDAAGWLAAGPLALAATQHVHARVRHQRPALLWRVVEAEDGRLEWRVTEDQHVHLQVLNAGVTPVASAPIAAGPAGVAA